MHGMTELPVSQVFNVSLGDGKYTKAWCKEHHGKFPVYSGKTTGVYDSIDGWDIDFDCLTWTKDGLAGYIMLHEDERFAITNHRGLLKLRKEWEGNISLAYARYVLEPLFRQYRTGRLADGERNEYTTLSKETVSKTMMPIPILDDGTPDIERQTAYASKMAKVEALRVHLHDTRMRLANTIVNVEPLTKSDKQLKNVQVKDLFDVRRGKSTYTRNYMQTHQGQNPVYSARNDEMAGSIDTADYTDGVYLTVSLNGLAGFIMQVNGPFSCTSDRAVLIPRKTANVNLTYVKAMAESKFRQQRHGRLADGEKNEYTKLSIDEIKETVISFPVNSHGEYDSEKQERIANRYSQLLEMRRKVLKDLDALGQIDVSFAI